MIDSIWSIATAFTSGDHVIFYVDRKLADGSVTLLVVRAKHRQSSHPCLSPVTYTPLAALPDTC